MSVQSIHIGVERVKVHKIGALDLVSTDGLSFKTA